VVVLLVLLVLQQLPPKFALIWLPMQSPNAGIESQLTLTDHHWIAALICAAAFQPAYISFDLSRSLRSTGFFAVFQIA